MCRFIITTLVSFLILFAGCRGISSKNFPDQIGLKYAIVKSIKVPFHIGDTLLLDPLFGGLCGNSTEEEIAKYYAPAFDSDQYISILQKNYSGLLMVKNDSLFHEIDSAFNKSSNQSWDAFTKNKIELSVFGNAITNQSLDLDEIYTYNEESFHIEKIFSYQNERWTFKIIKSEKR